MTLSLAKGASLPDTTHKGFQNKRPTAEMVFSSTFDASETTALI